MSSVYCANPLFPHLSITILLTPIAVLIWFRGPPQRGPPMCDVFPSHRLRGLRGFVTRADDARGSGAHAGPPLPYAGVRCPRCCLWFVFCSVPPRALLFSVRKFVKARYTFNMMDTLHGIITLYGIGTLYGVNNLYGIGTLYGVCTPVQAPRVQAIPAEAVSLPLFPLNTFPDAPLHQRCLAFIRGPTASEAVLHYSNMSFPCFGYVNN